MQGRIFGGGHEYGTSGMELRVIDRAFVVSVPAQHIFRSTCSPPKDCVSLKDLYCTIGSAYGKRPPVLTEAHNGRCADARGAPQLIWPHWRHAWRYHLFGRIEESAGKRPMDETGRSSGRACSFRHVLRCSYEAIVRELLHAQLVDGRAHLPCALDAHDGRVLVSPAERE